MGMKTTKLSTVRQSLFIPWKDFLGVEISAPTVTVTKDSPAAGTAIGLFADADDTYLCNNGISATRTGVTGVQKPVFRSLSQGNPESEDIGGEGYLGLKMVSAADAVKHFMEIPSDWDRHQPIDVRMVWSHACTGAAGDRDITWAFSFLTGPLDADGTFGLGDVDAYVLSFDPDVPVTEYEPHVTGAQQMSGTQRGTTADSRGANHFDDEDRWIKFYVAMTAFDASFTEAKYFLGVLFEYTPKLTLGHSHRRARPWRS